MSWNVKVGFGVGCFVLGIVMAGMGDDIGMLVTRNGCDWNAIDDLVPKDPAKQSHEKSDVKSNVFGVYAVAVAFTESNGDKADGTGIARVSLSEARAHSGTTVIHIETWKNSASTQGRVSFQKADLLLDGKGETKESASAATLGYCEFESSITSTVTQTFDDGLESKKEKLGGLKIKIKDVGIDIPITVAVGSGTFGHNEAKHVLETKTACRDDLVITHKTNAQIKIIAASGLFQPEGSVDCDVEGTISSVWVLDCCPGS